MLLTTIALIASQALTASTLPSVQTRQGSARAFATSEDLTYKLSEIDAPEKGPGSGGASPWNLTIDDTEAGYKQTVAGFGGTVTDATVTVINALPSEARSRLLRELLTSDGADFSFLRHTIAASDLSGPPAYTYEDNQGSFGLGERGDNMAKLLAEMKGIRSDAIILGSAWSAPAYMKVNRQLTGNADGNWLDSQFYANYADYFVKYLKAYADLGAEVDAITIQNEPLNNQGGGHVTMAQSAEEAGQVTQEFVGPALRAAGLNTEIWAYDHNTDVPSYPQTVVDAAGEYVQAAAWHCYQTDVDWTVISDFKSANPDKKNHMTECWTSHETPWYQSSRNTVGPLQNWVEASGMWTFGTWTRNGDTYGPYIPGGCGTCRGLFMVDEAAGTYEYTIDHYVLAQFSKFIPKGATILSGSGSWSYEGYSGIQSVASLNPDGTRTVVIENTFGNDVQITLETSSGETWNGNVLANSVVTWILP